MVTFDAMWFKMRTLVKSHRDHAGEGAVQVSDRRMRRNAYEVKTEVMF